MDRGPKFMFLDLINQENFFKNFIFSIKEDNEFFNKNNLENRSHKDNSSKQTQIFENFNHQFKHEFKDKNHESNLYFDNIFKTNFINNDKFKSNIIDSSFRSIYNNEDFETTPENIHKIDKREDSDFIDKIKIRSFVDDSYRLNEFTTKDEKTNLYSLNDEIYFGKKKTKKIVTNLNEFLEKDFKSSNNLLLYTYFEKFYLKREENSKLESNDFSDLIIKQKIPFNLSYYDFDKSNFSHNLNIFKKVKFGLLIDLINAKENKKFSPKNFSLEFNISLFNELDKIEKITNQNTLKKSILIIPLINMMGIYIFHKRFGDLVRYRYKKYFNFSVAFCLISNFLVIPLLKNLILIKNIHSQKLNLDNILISEVTPENEISKQIKENIFKNYPQLINKKRFLKIFEFVNKDHYLIENIEKFHSINKKEKKESFLNIIKNCLIFKKLKGELKAYIYQFNKNNSLVLIHTLNEGVQYQILDWMNRERWRIMRRSILIKLYLNNLKYKGNINEVKNERNMSTIYDSKTNTNRINFIEKFKHYNETKLNNIPKINYCSKQKQSNFINQEDLNILKFIKNDIKKKIWKLDSNDYLNFHSKQNQFDQAKFFDLANKNNFAILYFEKYFNPNKKVLDDLTEKNISKIIQNKKLKIAKIFCYFDLYSNINKYYSYNSYTKEIKFYLNYLNREESYKNSLFVSLFKYLFSNRKLFKEIIKFQDKDHYNKEILVENINSNDIEILFSKRYSFFYPDFYQKYYVYPTISSLILNYLFLNSLRFIQKLI